jgi:hypothetical protein
MNKYTEDGFLAPFGKVAMKAWFRWSVLLLMIIFLASEY